MEHTTEEMHETARSVIKEAGKAAHAGSLEASLSASQSATTMSGLADVCERLDRGNALMARIVDLLEEK